MGDAEAEADRGEFARVDCIYCRTEGIEVNQENESCKYKFRKEISYPGQNSLLEGPEREQPLIFPGEIQTKIGQPCLNIFLFGGVEFRFNYFE